MKAPPRGKVYLTGAGPGAAFMTVSLLGRPGRKRECGLSLCGGQKIPANRLRPRPVLPSRSPSVRGLAVDTL